MVGALPFPRGGGGPRTTNGTLLESWAPAFAGEHDGARAGLPQPQPQPYGFSHRAEHRVRGVVENNKAASEPSGPCSRPGSR